MDIAAEIKDLGNLGDLAVKFTDDKKQQQKAKQIVDTTQQTPKQTSTQENDKIMGFERETLIGAGAVAVGLFAGYKYFVE